MTVASTPPLTPDFYDYRWHPLCDVRLTETGLEVGWDDGVTLTCHRWWLRENAVVEGSPGIDPAAPTTMVSAEQARFTAPMTSESDGRLLLSDGARQTASTESVQPCHSPAISDW